MFLCLCDFLWQQCQKSGALNRLGDLPLVFGARAGFFLGTDFSRSGSKPLQGIGIFKINLLNVFLTKITSHVFPKSKCKNQNEK